MKIHTPFFGFALLVFLVALSSTSLEALQIDDKQKIDIQLQAADLGQTLQSFADISGAELDLDPQVTGTVTIDLESVRWRTALDTICKQNQLTCELLEGDTPTLRVRPANPPEGALPGMAPVLDLHLLGGDVRETLRAFGKITGQEVIIEDGVSGTVTLSIEGIPWSILAEEICELVGCRILWEADSMRVVPLDEEPPSERREDLRLDGVELSEALAIVTSLPIFGPLGTPAVTVAEGLVAFVDVELREASWAEMLDAVCEAAGCRWIFHYGVESRVEVAFLDSSSQEKIHQNAGTVPLRDVAAKAAEAAELTLRVDPYLPADVTVEVSGGEKAWSRALYEACRQAACQWRIDGDTLVLESRIVPLATHPISGTRSVELPVRLTTDAGETVARNVQFTWAATHRTLYTDGTEPRILRVSWIPFASDFHIVVPIVARCEDGELREPQMLEPTRLPLSETRTARSGDVEIELGGTPFDHQEPQVKRPECLGPPASELEVQLSFPAIPVRDEGERQKVLATLSERLGAYLLVTPPGLDPTPIAAIVILGHDSDGRHLAILRPEADGIAVDHRTLAPGQPLHERLLAPGGQPFELTVESVAGSG